MTTVITPSGAPYWAGTNTHGNYGGDLNKTNFRSQGVTNDLTDVGAEQFARMAENVAAAARTAPFCKLLLNVSSATPPHFIDWIRFGACRVGNRQSLVIRGTLGALEKPPPIPNRNYLLHWDSPYDCATPPDQDPLVPGESNGFPIVSNAGGDFSFTFALDYCDQYGVVNATNIRQVRAFPQTTSLRIASTQVTSARAFSLRITDITGTQQYHPVLISIFTSNA